MSIIETGGPAFPVMPPQDTGAGSAVGYPFPESGMTLRDYFAAKIVGGMMVDPNCREKGEGWDEWLAEISRQADALEDAHGCCSGTADIYYLCKSNPHKG